MRLVRANTKLHEIHSSRMPSAQVTQISVLVTRQSLANPSAWFDSSRDHRNAPGQSPAAVKIAILSGRAGGSMGHTPRLQCAKDIPPSVHGSHWPVRQTIWPTILTAIRTMLTMLSAPSSPSPSAHRDGFTCQICRSRSPRRTGSWNPDFRLGLSSWHRRRRSGGVLLATGLGGARVHGGDVTVIFSARCLQVEGVVAATVGDRDDVVDLSRHCGASGVRSPGSARRPRHAGVFRLPR